MRRPGEQTVWIAIVKEKDMRQKDEQARRDREVLLELGGGLHGRMAGLFCSLEGSVEAIRRYLAVNADEKTHSQLDPVLADMLKTIDKLSRLSANAADMALGHAAGFCGPQALQNLGDRLDELEGCVNEELFSRGLAARLKIERMTEESIWVMADAGLIDSLFVNLISNSLRACKNDAKLRIYCLPERELLYTDDGPGMEETACRQWLEKGIPTMEGACKGDIGLLLVRRYAMDLGWRLKVEPQPGFGLRMRLPAFVMPVDFGGVLRSSAREDENRRQALRMRIGKELDGVLGRRDNAGGSSPKSE